MIVSPHVVSSLFSANSHLLLSDAPKFRSLYEHMHAFVTSMCSGTNASGIGQQLLQMTAILTQMSLPATNTTSSDGRSTGQTSKIASWSVRQQQQAWRECELWRDNANAFMKSTRERFMAAYPDFCQPVILVVHDMLYSLSLAQQAHSEHVIQLSDERLLGNHQAHTLRKLEQHLLLWCRGSVIHSTTATCLSALPMVHRRSAKATEALKQQGRSHQHPVQALGFSTGDLRSLPLKLLLSVLHTLTITQQLYGGVMLAAKHIGWHDLMHGAFGAVVQMWENQEAKQ